MLLPGTVSYLLCFEIFLLMWLWVPRCPLLLKPPFVINTHTQTHTRTDAQHTQFWIHKRAVTPCLLPSNQFETLLSETFFNVPLLFLLPLLFNTLLYYPLISSLPPPCFVSFICFEHSGTLRDFGSSHHARRFQRTGDLRDTDTLQTALTNSMGRWKNRHPLQLLPPPPHAH